jgi:DDE superfamily endonuclease
MYMDKYYDRAILDLYSDYLISSFGRTTATGLSGLLSGTVSHDRVSRFMATEPLSSPELWRLVKPLLRQVEGEDGVIVADDSILEKPYCDESALVCWHWDHSKNRSVKGINLVSLLYHSPKSEGVCLPVAFELVTKEDQVTDPKTGHMKRKARVTKNELYRKMLKTCVDNRISFRYVVNDTWYSSAENMRYVKLDLQRNFVMALKSNRNVALSEADKAKGHYVALSELNLVSSIKIDHRITVSPTVSVWLEGVPFPLLLCRQVFTNEDGSEGIVYLLTSDTSLTATDIPAIYHRRWKVEEYHKSVKSNAGAEKSPARTIRSQTNHIFSSLYAYVKLETMRLHTHKNHFAMKAQLYAQALRAAFEQLQSLAASCSPA